MGIIVLFLRVQLRTNIAGDIVSHLMDVASPAARIPRLGASGQRRSRPPFAVSGPSLNPISSSFLPSEQEVDSLAEV
jgi:hypothetical protein